MFKLIILFYDSDVGCLLHLRQNTNLRHLGISGIWGVAGLLEILSQITSFDLETIDLELIDSDPVASEMAGWIRRAQLLTAESAPRSEMS